MVSTMISDSFILRDSMRTPITGKGTADFSTAEAFQTSDPDTTAPVTITEIGVGTGTYAFSFTATTLESWTGHVIYTASGLFFEFLKSYPVNTLVDPLGQAASGYLPGSVGYEQHALFKRPVVSEG